MRSTVELFIAEVSFLARGLGYLIPATKLLIITVEAVEKEPDAQGFKWGKDGIEQLHCDYLIADI